MDHKKYLAMIGRKGGKVKSERKAEACRQNATKPRSDKRCETCGEPFRGSRFDKDCDGCIEKRVEELRRSRR